MSYSIAVLLLGSNINNPENNINTALATIQERIGAILNKSELITSKPVEFDSNNYFCNIAVKIKTQLSPIMLLKELKMVEVEMGRTKDSSHFATYQDRIIDIDIVLYNNIRFVSKKLLIPHYKNLFEREFAKELIKQIG